MLTRNDIKKKLSDARVPQDKAVIVHSAMSTVGEIEGGIEGFLDALVEYFTSDGGLLVIPTHTWDKVGEHKITLDMTKAHTNLGILAKAALLDGRGIRSENPTHSVVVFGKREKAYTFLYGEDKINNPVSRYGVYSRLCEWDGVVLLVGVSHTANTYLHAVDEMIGKYDRMEKLPITLAVKRKSGEIVEREFYMFDESRGDLSYRFDKFLSAFRYHGAQKEFFLGDAPSLICDAGKMRSVVELIYSRAVDYDVLSDESPINPKFYVKSKL